MRKVPYDAEVGEVAPRAGDRPQSQPDSAGRPNVVEVGKSVLILNVLGAVKDYTCRGYAVFTLNGGNSAWRLSWRVLRSGCPSSNQMPLRIEAAEM